LEIDRARSLGVKFFIEKPFTIQSLAVQLRDALKNAPSGQHSSGKASS
jgi:hypothetical protein